MATREDYAKLQADTERFLHDQLKVWAGDQAAPTISFEIHEFAGEIYDPFSQRDIPATPTIRFHAKTVDPYQRQQAGNTLKMLIKKAGLKGLLGQVTQDGESASLSSNGNAIDFALAINALGSKSIRPISIPEALVEKSSAQRA